METRQNDTLAEAPRPTDAGRFGQAMKVVDLPISLKRCFAPADRVCLEGDNQKQADLLAAGARRRRSAKIHDIHMVQSGVCAREYSMDSEGIARSPIILFGTQARPRRAVAIRRPKCTGSCSYHI